VNVVEPPNELELNRALTKKINHLLCVMKAISRFRGLLKKSRAAVRADSGESQRSDSRELAQEKEKAEIIEALLLQRKNVRNQDDKEDGDGSKVQEVAESEPTFLGIGTGERDAFATNEATPDVVSDSPTAVDFNVYDRAYENAI
jgi:calcium/calmodulin-dependent protein kinase kinase 2